jgi:uncharacterized caspase-like protein
MRHYTRFIWFLIAIFFIMQARSSVAQPASTNRIIKDKWAVVIGIGDFASPTIPKLQYPAKDAQDFYDFLISDGHFQKDHVLLLKNQQATKDRILDAFGDNWLPRRVLKDDLVVIFLSSHGSPADVAGENFIVAYDTDPNRLYSTGIRFQDLAAEVTKRTGCDRLVMLLDACHSGAALEGGKGLMRTTNFNLDDVTGSGQLIISSSSPQQTSWESKRYANGVFTRKLIDSLETRGDKTTVSEAFKKLQDSVEQEVQFDRVTQQTPMMLSKWNGDDLELCALPAEARAVLPEVQDEEMIYSTPASPNAAGAAAAAHVQPSKSSITKISAVSVANTDKTPANQIHKDSHTANNLVASSSATIAPQQSTSSLSAPMMWTTWDGNSGDVTLERGTRLVNASELRALNKRELLLLYNEAYARHGRGFVTKEIQGYFQSQPWYHMDSDYHWRLDDARVIARKSPDDGLIINAKRTPKQWENMQTIKQLMEQK